VSTDVAPQANGVRPVLTSGAGPVHPMPIMEPGHATPPASPDTGSEQAFSAMARAVMAVARDGDADDGSCVLSQSKNNLGRLDLPSLRYIVESVELSTSEGPAYVGRLVFTGESDRSVADILGDSGPESISRDERDNAVGWLTDYLIANGGEMPWSDVRKASPSAPCSAPVPVPGSR
jgi:hypothetical protein